jgi:CheY-like chemotaxis protein
MRILLVEDNKTIGPEMVTTLTAMEHVRDVHLARSKAMGVQALEGAFYDLLILDLGLPLTDDDADQAVEHGQDLFAIAQEICPGLPIIVLTGSTTTAWGERLGRFGHNVDLWGSGTPSNTVDYIRKEDVEDLYREVERISAEVAAVNAIRINTRGKRLDLYPGWERAIRVAARKLGGVNAEVSPLSGGLSRVRVFLVKVFDGAGARIATMAAKLGDRQEVANEIAAYDRHVQRLPVGTFPHRTETLELGLCGKGAIFYRLADDYRSTLFDALAEDPQGAVKVIERLKSNMQIWIDAATVQPRSIAEIRRHILWDEEFEAIKTTHGLEVDDIEAMTVDVRVGCVHGDLHGGNVLIADPPDAVIIDFGDVSETSLCLDPVTLELCAVFHPAGAAKGLIADLSSYFAAWPDVDALPATDFGAYLRACREWSYDVGHDDLSVLATAYAYAVRQLRFDAVDKAQTLQLVQTLAQALRAAR